MNKKIKKKFQNLIKLKKYLISTVAICMKPQSDLPRSSWWRRLQLYL